MEFVEDAQDAMDVVADVSDVVANAPVDVVGASNVVAASTDKPFAGRLRSTIRTPRRFHDYDVDSIPKNIRACRRKKR